jgi:micrococcal nuclease
LLAVLAAIGLAAGPASAAMLQGRVTRVVDGDTVKVEVRGVETTVRLVGIDTPETVRPGTPVECFGPAASARAKRLLPPGRSVRLATDPTQDTRDRYGRLLAYVYEPSRAGARGSVNYALVAEGYAKVDVYGGRPFRDAPAFFRAQQRARVARTGLWGPTCNGDTTKPALIARRRPQPVFAPPGGGCNPNYRPCVPNSSRDLDCKDIRHPVTVIGKDVYHLDADGNGRGCESYG